MTSEVTQAALEPCPFCGGEAEEANSKGPTGERYRWVQCADCGAMTECCDDSARHNNPDEPEPVDLWNTRLTAQSGEGRSGAGEDWISHDGGDCPVDPAAIVEIKLRDGSVTTMAAKAVNWRYGTYIFEAHRTMPAFCEVVAYRLRAGEDAVEMIARMIAPSAWTVYDAEKARMLRKYKGENIGWPTEQYQHKASMDTARAILAALRATDDAGGAK